MGKEIIVAEKPKQAEAIKTATDGIQTIAAAGHLLGLKPKKRLWTPPYFELEWVTPNKKTDEKLKKIIKKIQAADEIIIGTDFDSEGQLIAYNILKEAEVGCKSVRRMKFSSLEHDELKQAYENTIEFDILLARSSEVRHYLDWYFGMNISKALTIRMKHDLEIEKKFYLTPVGRVQTPILSFLSIREIEILEFMSKDEWRTRVYGVIPGENNVYKIKTFFHENYEDVEETIEYPQGWIEQIIENECQRKFLPPNKDFVVKECLKQRINPDIVDRVMQELYIDRYISYPRTTSKNYTEHGIDTKKYLNNLDLVDLEFKVDPNSYISPNEESPEGPHPALYPLRHYPDRDIGRLVWNVIVESFVKCHLPPEEYIERITRTDIGSCIIEDYGTPESFKEGINLDLFYDVEKIKTTPPRRYDLQEVYDHMIKSNLGTVDTRTQILTKILRTYVFQTDDGLFTSSKGVKVINTIKVLCPDLISVDLTKKFENQVLSIQKDDSNINNILKEAKETVSDIVQKILEKKS